MSSTCLRISRQGQTTTWSRQRHLCRWWWSLVDAVAPNHQRTCDHTLGAVGRACLSPGDGCCQRCLCRRCLRREAQVERQSRWSLARARVSTSSKRDSIDLCVCVVVGGCWARVFVNYFVYFLCPTVVSCALETTICRPENCHHLTQWQLQHNHRHAPDNHHNHYLSIVSTYHTIWSYNRKTAVATNNLLQESYNEYFYVTSNSKNK